MVSFSPCENQVLCGRHTTVQGKGKEISASVLRSLHTKGSRSASIQTYGNIELKAHDALSTER
jgi:hypothetical protein